MWGQDTSENKKWKGVRIIPTRVGTSFPFSERIIVVKDHPHACGDKVDPETVGQYIGGSSPRVWGQGIVADVQLRPPGIIPTRVGTRFSGVKRPSRSRDHPHACGDKKVRFVKIWQARGSSPRVWGQALMVKALEYDVRIIPTRVGTRPKQYLDKTNY